MNRALLFLLVGLAGCATLGPDYQRPDVVPLPKQYPEPSPAGEAAASIPADWWKLYSDATLEQLIAAGRKTNADVRLAVARVQEAEAALREVRASIFPEVTGTAAYTRQGVSTAAQPPVPPGIATGRPNYQARVSTS
jgi:multidrug efflux system outer membrane protein